MKFKVIIADPPWSYNNYKKAANGAPQYKTMQYADMKALPVQKWAEDDCLLCMWTTWPLLPQGVNLVKDWGFEYVTGWPWIKTVPSSGEINTGVGFWNMSCSEILLIARKGNVSPPKVSKHLGLMHDESVIFYSPATRKHSRKPENLHEWVEVNYKGPYLELFATQQRKDWTCWGLDLGYELTPEGVISHEDGCKVLKTW